MYKQDAFLKEEVSTLKRPPSALISVTESNRSCKMHNKQKAFDTSRDQSENEAIVSVSAGSSNHTISLTQPIVSDNSLYTAATTICTTTKYITNIPSAKTTSKTNIIRLIAWATVTSRAAGLGTCTCAGAAGT